MNKRERTMVCGWIDAEPEYIRKDVSDALIAAAYVSASQECLGLNADDVIDSIRALTPTDARAVLDALLKAEREAGEREGREKALREAVDIAHDHKGFRPAAAWSDDECQGYQNGQIDIQSAISDALRALAEKDATP